MRRAIAATENPCHAKKAPNSSQLPMCPVMMMAPVPPARMACTCSHPSTSKYSSRRLRISSSFASSQKERAMLMNEARARCSRAVGVSWSPKATCKCSSARRRGVRRTRYSSAAGPFAQAQCPLERQPADDPESAAGRRCFGGALQASRQTTESWRALVQAAEGIPHRRRSSRFQDQSRQAKTTPTCARAFTVSLPLSLALDHSGAQQVVQVDDADGLAAAVRQHEQRRDAVALHHRHCLLGERRGRNGLRDCAS